MGSSIPQDGWASFCYYFKEAADEHPYYTMPDLAKLGDVGYNLGQALGCVVAAAAASAPLAGQGTSQRFAEHMLASGNVSGLIFMCRYFGWKLAMDGIPVAASAIQGGTARIALRTLTLGVGGTVGATAVTVFTGLFAAGYVGTFIGCFSYASLRSIGFLDPSTGWMGQAAARWYGYDPVADRAVDERLRVLRAKSALMRLANRTGAVVPHQIVRKF